MVYYEIKLFTNKADSWHKLPWIGGVQGTKWLKYDGDDMNLQFGEEREDEYLATKILIQNMKTFERMLLATTDPKEAKNVGNTIIVVEHEDQVLELLHGKYEKVIVSKYLSDVLVS